MQKIFNISVRKRVMDDRRERQRKGHTDILKLNNLCLGGRKNVKLAITKQGFGKIKSEKIGYFYA